MSEAKSIQRKKSNEDEYGFESLKQQGIRFAQELSGDLWTDYNLHDPGVTILDQLCYGLTDIIYRTGFEVEDFLTGEDGTIDCDSRALHPPERILPCRPTTIDDYRKAIFDAVPEIDNVWLSRLEGTYGGLFRVALRLKRDVHETGGTATPDIRARVAKVCSAARNLCEDIQEIGFVQEIKCELHAGIEVDGTRDPDDILSEIYYVCSRIISGGIASHTYDEALREGAEPEELFRGPFTRFGLIRDDDLDTAPDEVRVSDLYSAIRKIGGVENITSLFIEKDGRYFHTGIECEGHDTALFLHIPRSEAEIGVRLTRSGRGIAVPVEDLAAGYDELDFIRRSMRHTPQDITAISAPPQGEFRNLRQYYSIQNQFPPLYGINRYGVPASAPLQTKAKAAQLKGYLLPFEQLMANFLANLQNLRELFSVETGPKRSYAFQMLDGCGIAGLDRIYPDRPDEAVGSIVAKYDRFYDRKSRLLDYLISLYGETFPATALKDFNHYHSSLETDEIVVEKKSAFLKEIVEIGRERGAAPDCGESLGNPANVSGLKRRVSLLLGLGSGLNVSLTLPLLGQGLKLVPDEVFTQVERTFGGLAFLAPEDVGGEAELQDVPLVGADDGNLENLLRESSAISPLDAKLLPESLLLRGILLDRYRTLKRSEGKTELLFKPYDEGKWWRVAEFTDRSRAVVAVNALRRLLIRLSLASEGMHVVEHILLRPMGIEKHEDIDIPPEFYPFRVSVIFPAWTARCRDEDFRRLAEDTVIRNCPAHVFPGFYWLNFEQMMAFEGLFKQWAEEKSGEESGGPGLNNASRSLIRFLIENEAAGTDGAGGEAACG